MPSGTSPPRGLPHDRMTGQPYVYRALPGGTYLLYSVGWNQADDGGHLGYNADSTGLDPRSGDWVWSCPDTAAHRDGVALRIGGMMAAAVVPAAGAANGRR